MAVTFGGQSHAQAFNPLDSEDNYSATSTNTKLVHWSLMGGLLHLVQRGRAWAGCGPAQSPSRCTKCNSPPINSQCTNDCIAIWWFVALQFSVVIKGSTASWQDSEPVSTVVTPVSPRRTPQLPVHTQTAELRCLVNNYYKRPSAPTIAYLSVSRD